MKRAMYVSIPQPCHENWDAMTPQDKGRFCASCAKTVIDFSRMSDTQVLNYLLQTTGRVCGRFAEDQLERPLVPVKKEKKKIWWMAALMPLTLLLNKANGQLKTESKLNVMSCNQYERSIGLVAVGRKQANDTAQSVNNKKITGIISDEKGNPISGASVILKGTVIGSTTDQLGTFHLNLTHVDSSVILIVSAIGYEEKEFHYIINNDKNVNINIQSISLAPAFTGDVVVIAGGITSYKPVKKIDAIKTNVRKLFHANPFKVYPNPVNRGNKIHIEVKNEGHYSIQLLNTDSKLIANSLFDAIKGATTTSLDIPSSTAAGIYFIRLINAVTKQQYTDKIIVR